MQHSSNVCFVKYLPACAACSTKRFAIWSSGKKYEREKSQCKEKRSAVFASVKYVLLEFFICLNVYSNWHDSWKILLKASTDLNCMKLLGFFVFHYSILAFSDHLLSHYYYNNYSNFYDCSIQLLIFFWKYID